jgi:hypothetical protein
MTGRFPTVGVMTADLRRIDPPRAVEVLHDDGRWHDGAQDGWVRWLDGSWRASVTYSVVYDWGPGTHLRSLPAERVRLPEE